MSGAVKRMIESMSMLPEYVLVDMLKNLEAGRTNVPPKRRPGLERACAVLIRRRRLARQNRKEKRHGDKRE